MLWKNLKMVWFLRLNKNVWWNLSSLFELLINTLNFAFFTIVEMPHCHIFCEDRIQISAVQHHLYLLEFKFAVSSRKVDSTAFPCCRKKSGQNSQFKDDFYAVLCLQVLGAHYYIFDSDVLLLYLQNDNLFAEPCVLCPPAGGVRRGQQGREGKGFVSVTVYRYRTKYIRLFWSGMVPNP